MLNAKNITPKFGTELEPGIQLIELSDAALIELQQLAAERGIVVVRDQNMTQEQQANFAHRLGEPLLKPNAPEGMRQELIPIKADGNSKYAAGELWHSDVSNEPEPPGLSMLRIEVTPSAGGDTLFADMYQAFEKLSEPLQRLILGLTANHTPRAHYLYTSGAKKYDELPTTAHPMVRVHPLTQRRALFVNEGFVSNINGLRAFESRAILRMIYDHVAYAVNIQCRVRWAPNTVVFWDNRCVQHYASFDYFPETRLGYRITIRGERPVPA